MSQDDEEMRRAELASGFMAVSLRTKLLIFAATLIIVPGLIFGLIVQQSQRASLQALIGSQLVREAQHTANRLSGILLAEQIALKNFSLQDLMREVRVGDIDKRVSLALRTLREGESSRLDYLVLANGAEVIASSNADLFTKTPDWFQDLKPLSRTTDSLLGPIESRTLAKPVLLLSTPIPDPDDASRLLGLLIGVYDWRALMNVTRSVQDDLAAQGTRTQVFVVGGDGAIIGGATLDPEQEARFRAGWLQSHRRLELDDARFSVLKDAGLLVGHASLGPNVGEWQLVIVEELDDALAPVRALAARLAWILAGTLCLALIFALIAARSVVHPLSELTEAVRGAAAGDLSSLRVPVRSEDEVGSLSSAFNRMATELDQAQRNVIEAAKYALVGELASGVAHEVRTSLGVLRGSTQILERSIPTDADPHGAELAQLIRAEVDRLGGIVNELLELGRPRALHPEEFPISAPVQRAIELLEGNAAEKSIELRADPMLDEDHCVWGDAELIYQVVLNLLVNAIQAVEHHGLVEISTFVVDEGHLGLEVRDDGPGIPEDFAEKLFRPFVTAREGGIGLGLTFVQRVVYEHHGRIHVESAPGRGASFRVELPVAEEES